MFGERVLAASAFLDDEKLGDRALFSLAAGDGSVQWKTPLKLNPWGGPSQAENAIVVGCSSIRFDPKQIRGAQGEVVAINAADGMVKWRTPVPGGVVSPVAIKDQIAVFTATDGMVRALDLEGGQQKWTYNAGAPFFAGAAVTAETAYAADLKGVVHAISLADGSPLWKLNLATAPEVKAPGMVYGSPVLQQGRLYVATCNVEGGGPMQQTVVVCIGDK